VSITAIAVIDTFYSGKETTTKIETGLVLRPCCGLSFFQGSMKQKPSFFGITVLLYQNKNPGKPLVSGNNFV
jgi:hypothetical protein